MTSDPFEFCIYALHISDLQYLLFISHFTNCTDTKYCFSKCFQHEATKRSSVNGTSSCLSVNQLVRMTWLLLLCFVNQFLGHPNIFNSSKLFPGWWIYEIKILLIFYWFSGRPGVFSAPDPLPVLPHWRHLQSLRQRWQIVPRDIPETLQLPEQQQSGGHRVCPRSPDVSDVCVYHSSDHRLLPAPAESLVPEWDH